MALPLGFPCPDATCVAGLSKIEDMAAAINQMIDHPAHITDPEVHNSEQKLALPLSESDITALLMLCNTIHPDMPGPIKRRIIRDASTVLTLRLRDSLTWWEMQELNNTAMKKIEDILNDMTVQANEKLTNIRRLVQDKIAVLEEQWAQGEDLIDSAIHGKGSAAEAEEFLGTYGGNILTMRSHFNTKIKSLEKKKVTVGKLKRSVGSADLVKLEWILKKADEIKSRVLAA